MALTDLCLKSERPLDSGVQRTYALPNGYELSLINSLYAHTYPYAWEGAVINPRGRLEYGTPLTSSVEVFLTDEQADAWIIHAIEWAVMTKYLTAPATALVQDSPWPSPFNPAYGLADITRERAVKVARDAGVRAAIEQFHVSQASVYRWLKAYASSDNAK